MEATIEICDYLSEEEMKAAAREAFQDIIRRRFDSENDIKRIISNEAYEMVWTKVDEVLDTDIKDMLAAKVKEIISDKMSAHSIFRGPDAWDTEPNTAYRYLQKCIEEEFPKIKACVGERVEQQTVSHLRDSLNDFIVQAVQEIYKADDA